MEVLLLFNVSKTWPWSWWTWIAFIFFQFSHHGRHIVISWVNPVSAALKTLQLAPFWLAVPYPT